MAKKKPKTKPKTKPIDDDFEDDDLEPESTKIEPKHDVFVGLAALTLLALVMAATFFYLDHDELSAKSFASPSVTLPGLAENAKAPGRN